MCPDAHTIAGEFNRADLLAVLLKLSQISDKGRKHARQGLYQHQTRLHSETTAPPGPTNIIPAYSPTKTATTTIKAVKTCPDGASQLFLDCLNRTN